MRLAGTKPAKRVPANAMDGKKPQHEGERTKKERAGSTTRSCTLKQMETMAGMLDFDANHLTHSLDVVGIDITTILNMLPTIRN